MFRQIQEVIEVVSQLQWAGEDFAGMGVVTSTLIRPVES
jgi:hypothetical protein